MKEAARILTQFGARPDDRVGVGTRLLLYFGLWLFPVLAFQLFLLPEGLAETNLTPIQQRLLWPFYTPLMAAIGLAQAITWPVFPGIFSCVAAGACIAVHGVIAVTRTRRGSVAVLACLQVLLLAVAVIYFVRQAQLPIAE